MKSKRYSEIRPCALPVGNALHWKVFAYSEGRTVWEVFCPSPRREVILDAALKDFRGALSTRLQLPEAGSFSRREAAGLGLRFQVPDIAAKNLTWIGS